ncbi:GGDEF domain-containing protein [Neobacillus sp. LXY-1]|uniref:GGDEF domain-containing protein n=1 Tax=Neobacillus sp. LXY-1 TaxID=3379133 RepID=UPI003EDF9064
MNEKDTLMEIPKLNKLIRKISWWSILVGSILTCIGLLTTSGTENYIRNVKQLLFLQSMMITSLLIVIEILYRLFKRWNEYFGLLGLLLSLLVYIWLYPYVNGIHFILFIAIVISALYLEYEKVYFTSALCLISIVGMFFFHKPFSRDLTAPDLLLYIGVYICFTIISLGIISRGKQFFIHLEKSNKEQEELLVKNILMDRASKIDPLTDLYNHKTFHEYLEGLIEQSENNQLPLQLAIIDIDNFKKVNDNYGHWVGDIVLKRVSDQIKAHITLNDFASRYGGEEFSVIFTEKSIAESFALTEQLRKSVSQMIHEELDHKAVTVSIGLSSYDRGRGKENFFKMTDDCLYEAKHNGKNQTVIAKNTE